MEDQTSLKQIIQSMSPDGAGVVEGTVTNVSPLEITLTNDAKMILSANSLIVPEHLTDHEIEADIMKDDGALYAPTGAKDEKGEHEHPGIEKSGKHAHELKGFQLTGGKIILHTGLKAGEIVYLLSYNNGKKYYVLDRRG
jgi:hypothetical protein|nr:DUF2577 domain-containing protein [uncultured Acetatifactor sp.]